MGKSTLAGVLAHLARRDGHRVLAVDADPDANLAAALGIPDDERRQIIPIAARTELIEERTGAKLKEFGQIFKLNPDISDVADRFGYDFGGIHVLVLGAIEAGGSGCACPENVFLRNLLTHIVLRRDEFVIMDMEAGIEHLGRGTARGVDMMVVVAEPTLQSVDTCLTITRLAEQIGVHCFGYAGNKIISPDDERYLLERLPRDRILGFIPHSPQVGLAHREGTSLFEKMDGDLRRAFGTIYGRILSQQKQG